MKKIARKDLKLKLTRETLRSLEQDQLKAVEGGSVTNMLTCLPSYNTCNSLDPCTSRYCW